MAIYGGKAQRLTRHLCNDQVGVLGDVLTNAPNVTSKGRLGPGQMICADYEEVRYCRI